MARIKVKPKKRKARVRVTSKPHLKPRGNNSRDTLPNATIQMPRSNVPVFRIKVRKK